MAELVHPERPLGRGFVRVTDRAGRTLMRSADALAANALRLRFADGTVDAQVGTAVARTSPVEGKRRRPYAPQQAGLFDESEE
jgi:exodeoxyribonuclease VII large subunit